MSIKTRNIPKPLKLRWVALVTDAMLLAKGDRKEAAKLLGWSEKTLLNEIYRSGVLKARWAGSCTGNLDVDQPQTDDDVVNRMPAMDMTSPDEPVTEELLSEKRKALLIAAADREFKSDLSESGLTEQELICAVASQKFGAKQKRSSYEMINGSAPINHVKMQTRLRVLEVAIETSHQWLRDNPDPSENRSEVMKEIKILYTAYRDIQEQCRRNQETCNKGLMGLAILRLKEEKSQQKTGKMGFAPINIGSSPISEVSGDNGNGSGEEHSGGEPVESPEGSES